MAKRNPKIKDKTGLKYGKLLVVKKITDEEALSKNFKIFSNNLKNKISYYLCVCECGKEVYHCTTSLQIKNRGVRSCGCLRDDYKSTNPTLTSITAVFKGGVYSDGNLSLEDFIILCKKKCFYCGAEPKNIANIRPRSQRDNNDTLEYYNSYSFLYNGLDRINSSKKHDTDNVVPCCKICNRAKSDMSFYEFNQWITKIIDKNKFNKKIISHRGNLDGKNIELENNPEQIKKVLNMGFDVEIDLRIKNNKLYLGHDEPQYEIDKDFLFLEGLWIHCKDILAATYCINYAEYLNIFVHDKEDYALTTQKYIWVYPGKYICTGAKSIAVLPELVENWDISNAYGVCTDFPLKYSNY